jgi:hypothetical protein
MADEEKLGPGVTYLGNDDEDKQPVTIAGVRFKPGEEVDLVERLGEKEAQSIIKSLAGNRFFQVAGGPDHRAVADAKAQAAQKEQEEEQEELRKQYEAPEENQLEKPSRSKKKSPGEPTFDE